MLLKNTSARLITVRTLSGESYKILPGNNPDTEVPRDACQSDFVKALIANGDLIVTSDDEPEEVVSEFDGMSKDDLIALCEVKEIETNSRDTVKTLIAKLSE
tara:strand:+ start:22330 stop:22635 length:306 start_codon:yes stop_codon:yes gene_type:complete